jgi:hypothetical protein
MSGETIRTSADHMVMWQAEEIISKYPLRNTKNDGLTHVHQYELKSK